MDGTTVNVKFQKVGGYADGQWLCEEPLGDQPLGGRNMGTSHRPESTWVFQIRALPFDKLLGDLCLISCGDDDIVNLSMDAGKGTLKVASRANVNVNQISIYGMNLWERFDGTVVPNRDHWSVEYTGVAVWNVVQLSLPADFEKAVVWRIHIQEGDQWVPIAWSELRLWLAGTSLPDAVEFPVAPDPGSPVDPVLGPCHQSAQFELDGFQPNQYNEWPPISAAFWVKLDPVAADVRSIDILGSLAKDDANNNWHVKAEKHPKLDLWALSLGSIRAPMRAYPVAPFGKWIHLALLSDNRGRLRIYINGDLAAEGAGNMSFEEPMSLVINSGSHPMKLAKLSLFRSIVLSEKLIRSRIEKENPDVLKQSPFLLSLPLSIVEMARTPYLPDPSYAGVIGAVKSIPDDLLGPVLQFGGKDDRVEVGLPPSENWRLNRLLLALWCRIDAAAAGPVSVFVAGPPKKVAGIYLEGGTISFQWGIDTDHWSLAAKAPLTPGVWTHVAVIFDGTAVTLCLNGKSDNTVAWTGALPWSGPYAWAGGNTRMPDDRETVGFKGCIARVQAGREYDATKSAESLIADIIDRDLGAVAVGASGVPLEFSLLNEDSEPVLLLEDKAQELMVELRNTSGHVIDLPDPNTSHAMELRFRPGALREASKVRVASAGANSPGGAWTATYDSEPDSTDRLNLHSGGPAQLQPGETVRLNLAGVQPDRAAGARTTRVQLRYHLSYGDRYPLEGSRVHSLSFVYPVGEKAGEQELAAMVVGDAAVICDGSTTNDLTIRVYNQSYRKLEIDPKQPAALRVLLECNDTDDKEPAKFKNLTWGLFHAAQDVASISAEPVTKAWNLTAKSGYERVIQSDASVTALAESGGPDSFVDIKIQGFTCHGQPGDAMLHIGYAGFGKPDKSGVRPTGVLSVPVRRASIVSKRDNGALTTNISGAVNLARALRVEEKQCTLFDGQAGATPIDFSPAGGVSYAKPTEGEVENPGHLVPRGAVMMWCPSSHVSWKPKDGYAAVPRGWVLCDGKMYDAAGNETKDEKLAVVKTPDLTHKFIIGAVPGDKRDFPGASEGADVHSHTISTNPQDTTTRFGGKHSHYMGDKNQAKLGGDLGSYDWDRHGGRSGEEGEHDHLLNVPSLTGNSDKVPAGRPDWFALCFIMKL